MYVSFSSIPRTRTGHVSITVLAGMSLLAKTPRPVYHNEPSLDHNARNHCNLSACRRLRSGLRTAEGLSELSFHCALSSDLVETCNIRTRWAFSQYHQMHGRSHKLPELDLELHALKLPTVPTNAHLLNGTPKSAINLRSAQRPPHREPQSPPVLRFPPPLLHSH